MNDDIRYGIFMRPDPETCWNVTQVTFAVKQQFGLISAGAFPPHATLVGNLATDASASEIITRLDPVFDTVRPYVVYNPGTSRAGKGTLQYDINWDSSGKSINVPLNKVAQDVKAAVLPLARHVEDFLVVPVRDYHFSGHLGLASHDLIVDDRASQEVGEFISGLPLTPPAEFVARWYSLFEFRSDWTGHWWKTMTWRHLHSWEAR